MVFALRTLKTMVFTVFAFGSKNHGTYSLFVPAPSKNTGIYAVFIMLQDEVAICEADKNTVFHDVFAFRPQPKLVKMVPKWSKNDVQKHLIVLASSFPAPDPQKRGNTSRVKAFGGGPAAGHALG